MGRKLRTDYEGAWHHVMNRGARRAPILADDQHIEIFLELMGETVERFGIEIHAYALMPNHFHLLVRSVRGNISRAIQYLSGHFTRWVNARRKWDGPVFRGRFRSELIEDERSLLVVAAYIHLNPIRARLVRRLDARCLTSHRAYLGHDIPQDWLCVDSISDVAGDRKNFTDFVHDVRVGKETWPEDMSLETGFIGTNRSPAEHGRNIADARPATTISANEALKRARKISGCTKKALTESTHGRRGNPCRRFAVWALAKSTALTHQEIADKLCMSTGNVSLTLGRARLSDTEPLATWKEHWASEHAGCSRKKGKR
jgi:REP element-mobilizing transposase RayT